MSPDRLRGQVVCANSTRQVEQLSSQDSVLTADCTVAATFGSEGNDARRRLSGVLSRLGVVRWFNGHFINDGFRATDIPLAVESCPGSSPSGFTYPAIVCIKYKNFLFFYLKQSSFLPKRWFISSTRICRCVDACAVE